MTRALRGLVLTALAGFALVFLGTASATAASVPVTSAASAASVIPAAAHADVLGAGVLDAGVLSAGVLDAGVLSAGALAVDTPAVPETETDTVPDRGTVVPPAGPRGAEGAGSGDVTITLDGLTDKPSTPVVTILGLTLLGLAPSILLTCTSFTKILVVLGLTRNALGLQQTPPNQVLVGLALFLSLFIMAPVLTAMNDAGLQPYLSGDLKAGAAFNTGIEPLREFMLNATDDDELRLLTSVADRELPANRDEVSLTTLVPAFILTELKQAFIIGFIIFIPFLIIDIVVSGALMALGMMMMPPVMVSLPFKLLLFVMVDGWALIIRSIVSSYG